jgi:hypothetical protein
MLNLPSILPVNSVVTAAAPTDFIPVEFDWTITPLNIPSSSASILARSTAITAPISFKTSAPVFSLASMNLAPGVYSISVQAVDASGTRSAKAQQTVTLSSTGLSTTRVHPNPWRSDRDSAFNVTIDNLPAASTVKIFTASGHLARSLTAAVDHVDWDLRNDSGDKVASGLYPYLIQTPSGEKKTGQLVIIK